MPKRVFIGIKIPKSISKKLEKYIDRDLRDIFPHTRFVPAENMHITVSFLGDQDDDSIRRIVEVLRASAAETILQEICLSEIMFGPNPKRSTMIWVTGAQANSELQDFRNILEDGLIEEGVRFRPSHRPFSTHVTLARLREPARNVNVDFPKIQFSFVPQSMDLMQSILHPEGPEYISLFSAPLQEEA